MHYVMFYLNCMLKRVRQITCWCNKIIMITLSFEKDFRTLQTAHHVVWLIFRRREIIAMDSTIFKFTTVEQGAHSFYRVKKIDNQFKSRQFQWNMPSYVHWNYFMIRKKSYLFQIFETQQCEDCKWANS